LSAGDKPLDGTPTGEIEIELKEEVKEVGQEESTTYT
jgi:hypothetical protein